MAIDQAIKEAYGRAGVNTIHRMALEMRHSFFPAPVRFVDHTSVLAVPIESGAPVDGGSVQNFTPQGMVVGEPDVGIEPTSEIDIQIDSTDGSINALLAAANETLEPIEAALRPVAVNSATDSVIGLVGYYYLQVKSAAVDLGAVTITFGRVSPTAIKFPRLRYTPEHYPHLYR